MGINKNESLNGTGLPSFNALIIRANSLNEAAGKHLRGQLRGNEPDASFDEEIARALRRKEAKATWNLLEAQRTDVVTSLARQRTILDQLIAEGHMSARVRERFVHTINDLQAGVVLEGYRADTPQLAFPDAVLFPKAEEPIGDSDDDDGAGPVIIPEWLIKAKNVAQKKRVEEPNKRSRAGIAAIFTGLRKRISLRRPSPAQ